MNRQASKKVQDVVEFELKENYASLVNSLDAYQSRIPDEALTDILKEIGLDTSDKNVIKLIGAATDLFISEINESVLTLNPVPKRSHDILEDKDKEEKDKAAQKSKLLKDKHASNKTFTLRHLLEELEERGIKLNKPPYSANSVLMNEITKSAQE